MHEVATTLMKSAPGWTEIRTSNETFLFQFGDATMTIFPDGSWRCVNAHRRVQNTSSGKVGQLEKFLQDFSAANPL
jgi:hypothetical protein